MQDEWWYASGGVRKGPVKFEDLRQKVLEGSLSTGDLVWTAGMSQWTAASDVPALQELLQSLQPPELPPQLPHEFPPELPKPARPELRGSFVATEPLPLETPAPTPEPAGPWRRFFARYIDFWVIGLPTVFLVVFFLASVWPGFDLWLQQAGSDVVLGFLVIPLVLVIEAVIFELFGATLGKWLLGVHVKTLTFKSLAFDDYLFRQAEVYWAGLGIGFPLVSFFTQYRQYRRLNAGMAASYDEGLYKVTSSKVGAARYVLAVLLVVVAMSVSNGLLLLLNRADSNKGKVSKSQPTVSESQRTNPENFPATTSTGQLSSPVEGSPPPKRYFTEDDFDKPLKIPNNVGISANAKGLTPDGKLAIEIINNTSNWRVESISVLMTDAQQYADYLNERRLIPAYSEQYSAHVPTSENKLHPLTIQTNWKFDRG